MTLIFSIIVTITTITVIITIAACKPKTLPISLEEAATWTLPFLSLGLFTRSRYTEENLDSYQVRPKKEHVFYWRNWFANNLWYSILTREVNIQNQVANSEFHQSLIETRNKNTSHCSKVHSHSPLPKGSCWFIIHKHLNLPEQQIALLKSERNPLVSWVHRFIPRCGTSGPYFHMDFPWGSTTNAVPPPPPMWRTLSCSTCQYPQWCRQKTAQAQKKNMGSHGITKFQRSWMKNPSY